ncbi:DUF2877 domain-containing protein [Vibrio sp. ES.051]|uniref:DUF2877 domain-containing protein n=1 Tax=Vibrio sp. ES.051 TaxID=1761909 RepID=UPI0015CF71AF|nr:DUF2877 domain-containing protein [Vibrio sp. ES.051]
MFDKAINIVTNDPTAPWVSLLDLSLPNTPCGLKVAMASQPIFKQCQVKDRVYYRGGILRFEAQPLLTIDSRSAKWWCRPPKPREYQEKRLLNNIRYLESCFTQHINKNESDNLNIKSHLEYLREKALYFNFNLFSEPELITENIGKGQGLTPSGDDFICGVFALLTYVSKEFSELSHTCSVVLSTMVKSCQSNWQKTNEVSLHYLQQASKGDISQPVLWLVYSIFTSTLESEVEKALHNVLEIGSSSGCDIVSGILFGAHQLQLNQY